MLKKEYLKNYKILQTFFFQHYTFEACIKISFFINLPTSFTERLIREMSRSKEKLNVIITSYLKRQNIYQENAPWVIKESPLGGFGIFAKHDLDPGDLILHDYPIILGPRFAPDIPDMCVACFR